mgnify:CR=1 FL=1
MEAKPKKIKKVGDNYLKTVWEDGFESVISLENFRKECPCAQCQADKKEDKKTFAIPMGMMYKEGMNELTELKPMGNYAVKAVWGDGHDTGIYDWAYFRKVFEKHKIENYDKG